MVHMYGATLASKIIFIYNIRFNRNMTKTFKFSFFGGSTTRLRGIRTNKGSGDRNGLHNHYSLRILYKNCFHLILLFLSFL
jgi:hypothetical protein